MGLSARELAVAVRTPAALSYLDRLSCHPGVDLRKNLRPISHRSHLFEVAFVWELTEEAIYMPLGCLHGGAVLHFASEPEGRQLKRI